MKEPKTGRRRLLVLVFLGAVYFTASPALVPRSQTEPPKKDVSDYMNAIIQRNTKPLGLRDNPILTRLNKQPTISWAVRAVARHILD